MIELPPKIDKKTLVNALVKGIDSNIMPIVDKVNADYEYWDKVKYKKLPEGFTPQMLWTNVKASRLRSMILVWEKYGINLCVTSQMQRLCHEFDMKFGSFWEVEGDTQSAEKKYYLSSSLMEEAIYSSKMEGASTTRIVAKDMLRKKKSPQNKSQQMIANNYNTIQYIVEHKDEPLTEETLLHIHRLMTEKTMDNPEDTGRFRTNDKVVVADMVEGDIIYTPPSFQEIPEFVESLCDFFNNDNPRTFIHPIIRGIIVHFMLAFMHPFADGNGRTGRLLSNFILLRAGHPLLIIKLEDRSAYIAALKQIRTEGTDEHLVAFFFKTAIDRMKDELNQKRKKQSSILYRQLRVPGSSYAGQTLAIKA